MTSSETWREGFYFTENGEHHFYHATKAIGEALVSLGKSNDAEPTTFTQAELGKYFDLEGTTYLGSNCRCRANRPCELGWKPKKSTTDLIASIHPEVVALLSKT